MSESAQDKSPQTNMSIEERQVQRAVEEAIQTLNNDQGLIEPGEPSPLTPENPVKVGPKGEIPGLGPIEFSPDVIGALGRMDPKSGGMMFLVEPGKEIIIPKVSGGATGWLITDPTAHAGLASADLKRRLSMMDTRPDDLLGPEYLVQQYDAIENLITEGKAEPGEAEPYLATVQSEISRKRAEAAARSADKVPDTEVEQRKYARQLLELIEMSAYPLGNAVTLDPYNELSKALTSPRLEESVRKEIDARLRLHDCYAVISTISGKTEDMIGGFRAASQELLARGHLLEPNHFQLLLKEGLPGIRIREAFEAMQAIPGDKYSYVMSPAGAERLSREFGKDSFRLAFRIAHVTSELSVWNVESNGNDPLSEAVWFHRYRTSRFGKGRDSGPRATIPLLDCVATSFLRHMVLYSKTTERGGTLAGLRRDYERDPNRMTYEAMQREVRTVRRDAPLNLDEIDFARDLKPGHYQYWLAAPLPYMITAKELMLKEDWKPEEITRGSVERWIHAFNTAADPKDILELKKRFTLGMFDEGLRAGLRTGWAIAETTDIVQELTSPLGSDERGRPVAFLTQKQVDWVLETLEAGKTGTIAAILKALRIKRSLVNEVGLELRGALRVRGGGKR